VVYHPAEYLMPRILTLFLDGVGLGNDNPDHNPFSIAHLPTLTKLLGGQRLVAKSAPLENETTTLVALDARLGVEGTPQSATGQASLLTGRNVPSEIDEHYGPKPNVPIKDIVEADNLFAQVLRKGGRATLLNGYPPGYFDSINRRHRLYSVIPLAVVAAGLRLLTTEDMQAGRAFSADFTGKGWAAQHDFPPIPIYRKAEAGKLLALTSQGFDLSWFDFWLTDVAGHRQDMTQAVTMLEAFDEVLDGMLGAWPTDRDLVILVSDHGNLEDLSRRGHTLNPVPCLLIGPQYLRRDFVRDLTDLTGFPPAVLRILFDKPSAA
jgi:2,3-bisphosphoglycerate-independent phosphoglycerate mutase